MAVYQKHNSIFSRGCWVEPTRLVDPRIVMVICPTCICPQRVEVPVSAIVDGAATADVACGCCGRVDSGATLVGFDLPEEPPPQE